MRLMHIALLAMVSLLFSAHVTAQEVTVYQYGMKLDIKRVINITDTRHVCGITPSVMTYMDSKGNIHRLQYLVYGGGCSDH